MDLRIYKFDLKILEELTVELLTIDRYYNLGIINRSSRGGIELSKNPLTENLRDAFELFNQSINLTSFTYKKFDQDFQNLINEHLKSPLKWTSPQIRIDNSLNSKFSAPPHKDFWILGPNAKGIIIWLPLSDQGRLNIFKGRETVTVKKDPYWGLKIVGEEYEKDENYNPISIERGSALIFNHDLIHKSNPIKKGQITLQLRYWSPNNLSLRKDIINSLSVTTQKTIDSVTKVCQEIENLI